MSFHRPDLAVKVNIQTLKGYTMKQIGDLDNRISRLEYYNVLQALDTDASTLSIANTVTGIQRFKNGYFADPFNDFTLSDLSDPEYRIAIDSSASILRPLYSENYVSYELANTSYGYKIRGQLAMIDYDEEKIEANPSASTYRNPLEGYYSFVGALTVYPDHDSYTNTAMQPVGQTQTIDLTQGFKNLLTTGAVKAQDISSVTGNKVLTSSTTNSSGTTNYWSQTTTTTTKDLTVGSTSQTIDLGDVVTGVSQLPYIHGRVITAFARGLKPNTRMYPFFDNTPVAQYCAPGKVNAAFAMTLPNGTQGIDPTKLSNIAALPDSATIIDKNGSWGDAITTDSLGNLYFQFNIPDGVYRTGERTLLLLNVSDLKATGAVITSAQATYTASSLAVTKKDESFGVLQPTFNWVSTVSDTVSTSSTFIPAPPPPDPPNHGGGGGGGGGGYTGGGGYYSGNGGYGDNGGGNGAVGSGPGGTVGDCLVPWVKITMEDGSLNEVKNINIGDRVKSLNGTINTVIGTSAPVVNTKLVGFNDLDYFITETHPLYTNKGWGTFNLELFKKSKPEEYQKIVDDNNGNDLIAINENVKLAVKINDVVEFIEIKDIKFKEVIDFTVHRLSVDGDSTYISENYVSHNKPI
jgi:hypothetical protein